jgi:AcrR family transcriptional regulator
MANPRKARPGTADYDAARRQILEATIGLIEEKGFERLRFEELAERVGCARTTLYRYFDSKQVLLNDVMMHLMHEITQDILQATATAQPVTRERFTQVLYNIIDALHTRPRYRVIMEPQHLKLFADITFQHFARITSLMLGKHLQDRQGNSLLGQGMNLDDVVHWLIVQIMAYGFLGLKGSKVRERKEYLSSMVVSVIL